MSELSLKDVRDFPVVSKKDINASFIQEIRYCEGYSFIGFCGILLLYQYDGNINFLEEKERIQIFLRQIIEDPETCRTNNSLDLIFDMSCLGEGPFYVPNVEVAFPESQNYLSTEVDLYHTRHMNGQFIKVGPENSQVLSDGILIDNKNFIIGYWSIIK